MFSNSKDFLGNQDLLSASAPISRGSGDQIDAHQLKEKLVDRQKKKCFNGFGGKK
jgi:hypothetical protein